MRVLELQVETEVGKKERDRDRQTDRRPMAEIWWGREKGRQKRQRQRETQSDRQRGKERKVSERDRIERQSEE